MDNSSALSTRLIRPTELVRRVSVEKLRVFHPTVGTALGAEGRGRQGARRVDNGAALSTRLIGRYRVAG